MTAVCVADDNYLLSESPSGLRRALDIVSHYARHYHLKFNDKTKIVITGFKQDMTLYRDTAPWILNGKIVDIVENNEHLGLTVSGFDEEQKNVDDNINKCRKSLFALLNQALPTNVTSPHRSIFGVHVTFLSSCLICQLFL